MSEKFDVFMHFILFFVFPVLVLLSVREQHLKIKAWKKDGAPMPMLMATITAPVLHFSLLIIIGFLLVSRVISPQSANFVVAGILAAIIGVFMFMTIAIEVLPHRIAVLQASHQNKNWRTYVPAGIEGRFVPRKIWIPGLWVVAIEINKSESSA